MFRMMILAFLAALLLLPIGCASVPAEKQKPFAGFPFRHKGFDFKQAWKTSQSPQGLAVQGVLRNTRYARVEDVEIAVSLLKGRDKVAEEIAFVPGTVENDQYCNFAVLLKNVTVSPGDRLQFSVSYRAVEGSNQFKWTSIFSANAISGVVIRKPEEISSDEEDE
jgi:hypothetical protein